MASESQAKRAQKLFSKTLVRKGAHAIGVEPGRRHGHRGFVVVAYIDKPKPRQPLPASLSLPAKEGGKQVPLVVKQEQEFVPQTPK